LCEEILSILAQSKKRKHAANIDSPRRKIEKAKLNICNYFGKIDSTLTKVIEFVKEIADLLNESNSQQEKFIKIDRSKELIKNNIDKLVNHVLIEKDGKIQFNPTFFNDDNKLPGNLENFKGQLKIELKSKGISFSESELSQYTFDIEHFPKLNLPSANDKITDIEINDFFNHLVFAVNQPNEVELGTIIKNEIGKEFNSIDSKNVYSRFQKKMLNWMKEKEGRFLSHEEGKIFFEKLKKEILGAIWFDVRDPVELFTGRTRELDELHQALRRNQGKDKLTVISQMTSISGLGGVGKSELARKYAYDYGQDYDHNVIWINAEKYETLIDSFLRLAKDRLGIPTKNTDGKEKDIGSIVQEAYKYFTKKKSFDNAEKYKTQEGEDGGIDKFLPSLPPDDKPFILITSRNREWEENVEMLSLDTFTAEEATEFIRKALGIEDGSQENEVKKLAETLQRFPLALQQAVAYIKEESQKLENVDPEKKFWINDYLDEYKKEEIKTKELLDFHLPDKNGYTRTTFITWKITLEKIKQREYGKEALDIMDIIAYFAPNNIATKIFLEQIDIRELGSALQLLKQYSMICLEQGEANIHRLVQQVTRIELQGQNKEREVLREALSLLKKTMEGERNPGSEYTSHAVSAWNYASKYDELVKEFSELPNDVIYKLFYSVRYEEAYLFGERVSKLLKEVLGQNHPSTLRATHNIAGVLNEQGKYNEALAIYHEVLDKRKQILGSDHPDTLSTGNNMARVLCEQGKYDEALAAYHEVLHKRKQILGNDHPSTLNTIHNVALVLDNQGKYDEALTAYHEVLDKQKQILGSDHPDTLMTIHNVALVLDNQGKYDEALIAYHEVLDKRKQILGNDHPGTLGTRNNIAGVLDNQGKYDEALAAYHEVLDRQKQILGSDHPGTLGTRNNKAGVLCDHGT
jgi:tetratricopeptide (TPR) repeat protein